MRNRKFGALVILVCLISVLSGCGSSSTSTSKQGAPAAKIDYPTKTVELVVGWGVGGGTDIFARTLALTTQDVLGATITVVNKPGSAGVIGNEYVQRKAADGYTVINANPGLISNYLLGRDKYSYKDFVPVIRGQFEPGMWVVAADSKFKTAKELIDYAKANPGKLRLAGAGALGLDEIASRSVMMDAGIDLTYVPFDTTSEMHAALLGGHVDLMYEEPSIAVPLFNAKRMKPLLIFTDKKLATFPDTSCVTDLGFQVPPGTWRGIAVKKGTPDAIVKKLEEAFTKGMKAETYIKYEKAGLLDLTPGYMNGQEFGKLWVDEAEKYKKVLDKLGLLKVKN